MSNRGRGGTRGADWGGVGVPRICVLLVLALAAAACHSEGELHSGADGGPPPPPPPGDSGTTDALPPPMRGGAIGGVEVSDPEPTGTTPPPKGPLEIRFLGVGGFTLSVDGDKVLTAPLYTNPPLNDVLTGTVRSDRTWIDRFLGDKADGAKAILIGHGHYDHLMDVPYTWGYTNGAPIYGNISVKHMLAALAPDRPASCPTSTSAGDMPAIPRDKVIALDDPANDRVDYRLCATPQSDCPGANDGRAGEWVGVPASNVRIRGLCSSHPPQFLVFHFGNGCVDEDLCELPGRAGDWREGGTIAYLIDFLDPQSGVPRFRIYYQDAPTDAPVGNVHPDLLAEKRVDVALLCVGNYDQVRDHPGEIIRAMNPRYVIAGHWESFFRKQSEPLQYIPFLDVNAFVQRMDAELPANGDAPVLVNGMVDAKRGWLPDPGTAFVFSAETSTTSH